MIKPTILIGHGRFGKEVLQRLLGKTAPRGTLAWEQSPRSNSGAGEHRLRDLVLLWMPDPPRSGAAAGVDERLVGLDGADSKADFIEDLYRQIREIDRAGAGDDALADAVAEAAEGLRLPETIQRRGDGIPGLDIIIVAHVGDPGSIASLDLLTKSLLKRLVVENPRWNVLKPGDRALNCIQILDFENFRHPGADGQRIRQSLRRSMDAWKIQLDDKRPSLDRCYLIDGRAQDNSRDLKTRYDEITLFLELLLFSGLRGDVALKSLFEQDTNNQIAAAFGVRLMERSPQLLSRVAAARFGQGWLPYLRGAGSTGFMRPAKHLERALSPLIAQAQDVPEGETPIAAQWRTSVDTMAEELLTLKRREADDWPLRAQQVFAQHVRRLDLNLSRAALDQIRHLRETHLRHDGLAAIEEAVTRDLHDDHHPVPLKAVLNLIDAAIKELQQHPDIPTDRPGSAGLNLERALLIHRDYIAQRNEWISEFGRGLTRFWPLLAAVAGLAATPFVSDLILQIPLIPLIPPAAPYRQSLTTITQLLADRPVVIAPVLGLLVWLWLRLGVQPRISRSILRAQAFHLDTLRGRLSDAIRADCDCSRGLLDQARLNIRSTLSADLLHVLTRIRDHLERRDREIEWLRGQIGEFLKMQGLPAGAKQIEPPPNSVHGLIQGADDLKKMMDIKPLVPEQFEGHQTALPNPFEGWNSYYCDAFLDLFTFVNRLSAPYQDHFKNDLDVDHESPEWTLRLTALKAFTRSPFGLGFRSDADKTDSIEETYCIMPPSWKNQPEVDLLLNDIKVNSEKVRDGTDESRVYLLKRQFNIGLEALEASP
jgi:hypothetical protein